MRHNKTAAVDLHRIVVDSLAYGRTLVSLTSVPVPVKGYAVAGQAPDRCLTLTGADPSVTDMRLQSALLHEHVADYIERSPLLSVPGYYLACQKRNGALWLQTVKVTGDIRVAMDEARERDQAYVRNLETGQEIMTSASVQVRMV